MKQSVANAWTFTVFKTRMVSMWSIFTTKIRVRIRLKVPGSDQIRTKLNYALRLLALLCAVIVCYMGLTLILATFVCCAARHKRSKVRRDKY
jgi:hypothetical protein